MAPWRLLCAGLGAWFGLALGSFGAPLGGGAHAAAPTEAPDHGLAYTNLSVVRVNPLGLQDAFELDLWWRLFDPGDSPVLANNALSVGLAPILSPASARVGVTFKLRPLNLFKLEVRWEYLAYFGNFDFLQSFASPRADFSDTTLATGGDADRHYATDGWQLTLDGELRGRFGPVVVRSRFKASYVDVALERADTVFYEPYFDLLLPRAGWFLLNDADVLLLVGAHLTLGVRHSFAAVSYPATAYGPGEPHQTDSAPVHRLGPIVAWRFFDEPGAAFNQPTLLVLAQWYLQHRWRAGADVSQAIPYVVVAFAFTGELL